MDYKDILAYQGKYYSVEFYFDSSDYSQAMEYYNKLDDNQKAKALILFRRMAESGKIFDIEKFRNEGDKIYSFKPKPDRFLCFFFIGKKIIITNAFYKKTEKLPVNEKEKALRAKKDCVNRVRKGVYYESSERSKKN